MRQMLHSNISDAQAIMFVITPLNKLSSDEENGSHCVNHYEVKAKTGTSARSIKK